MIRHTPTYVATSAVGAIAALMMLIIYVVSPPTKPFFPLWFAIGIAALLLGWFIYNIYMRLSGRQIPRFAWERKLSDSELWTIKVIVLGGLAVGTALIIFYR